jgi:signal transduction histidine kinase
MALGYFRVVPASFLTEHAITAGSAAEALLLSFALADRINHARDTLSRRLIEAQDGERRRIAGELHDGLGQGLLVLTNQLKRLAKDDPTTEPAAAQAGDLVAEVRGIAHELHPHRLDRLGLSAAARSSVDETLGGAGIEVEHAIDDVDRRLPPAAALHLYRILQEALANVVKHSGARRARVVLTCDVGTVRLRVEDDGRGMDELPAGGLGLAGMRERARLLGGRVAVRARAGQGVTVDVELPVRPS